MGRAERPRLTDVGRLLPGGLLLPALLALCSVLSRDGGAIQPVYVKIVVDEEEVAPPAVWRERLKRRLQLANQVIGQYSSVRFAVRGFGTWRSDDGTSDFVASMKEFERKVEPSPADCVIGFTTQYRFRPGRDQLGGTRGALHSHILIREGNPQVFEPDRVEVLVHELGHFLGAAHSNQPDSIMRTAVGDGRARSKSYRIRFDRENGEIVRLVGREVAEHRVRRFQDLPTTVRLRLREQYEAIARSFPEDGAAKSYIKRIDSSLNRPGQRDRGTSSSSVSKTLQPR